VDEFDKIFHAEVCLGEILLRSISQFDKKRHTKFTTYYTWKIRGYIWNKQQTIYRLRKRIEYDDTLTYGSVNKCDLSNLYFEDLINSSGLSKKTTEVLRNLQKGYTFEESCKKANAKKSDVLIEVKTKKIIKEYYEYR